MKRETLTRDTSPATLRVKHEVKDEVKTEVKPKVIKVKGEPKVKAEADTFVRKMKRKLWLN